MPNCSIPTYLPASFKGVPFEALTVGSEHGRRGAEGEFPFGENTAYADLGRKIRTYSIKGRLAGPEHVTESAALIAACESKGPGVLVHPTRGVLTVACKKATFSDEIIDGAGVTSVDMEFVEANDFLVGLGASILGIQIAPFVTAALDAFRSSYDFASVPFYEKQGILDLAGRSLGAVRGGLVSSIVSPDDVYGWTAAADLARSAQSLPVRMDGSSMASSIEAGFMAIEASGSSSQQRYEAYRSIARFASQGAGKGGAAGAVEESLFSSLRLISVAHMARSAAYMQSATVDEAMARYDAVVTVLDEEAVAARDKCDDAMFMQIANFRAEAQRALLKAAFESPALVSYNFNGGVPSLVAAHEIYGDAGRFAEIEARNPLSWPFSIGPEIIAATVNV